MWETPLSDSPSPVMLVDDTLWAIVGGPSCTGQLTKLDPATGEVLTTEPTTTGSYLTRTVDGSTVASILPSACGPTGNEARLLVQDTTASTGDWTYAFPADESPTAPAMRDGTIFVASAGTLYAFTANDRPMVGPNGVVYTASFASSGATFVWAHDAASGAPLWHTDLVQAPGPGWQNLAWAHDRLYVADHEGGEHNIDIYPAGGCGQPACGPSWSASVDGPPVGDLVVGGDVLYAALYTADSYGVVAFDAGGCGAAVCDRLTTVDIGAENPIELAIAGGQVAVLSSSGSAGQTLRVLATEGSVVGG